MEVVHGERITIDWDAERARIEAQISDWDDQLFGEEDEETGERDPLTALRSDTAKVQALRHKQRCEEQLDRLDMMQKIHNLDSPIDAARAKATLATLEGSHGPAQQWTRLQMDMEAEARKVAAEQKRAAAEVGAPNVELVRLLRDLLEAPQSVRGDIVAVLSAGQLPEHWQPSLELVNAQDAQDAVEGAEGSGT